MRHLLIRSLCVGALVACSLPAAASADGGGASAPDGPRTDAGGSAYDQGYAQAEERRRAEAKERRRRAAARARQRRARARELRRAAEERRRLDARRQLAVVKGGSHRFPVVGPYDLGGRDGRFGAKRPGHRHQGQDISAALGTPVIAPWAGTVESVRYQRGGAGHYVVLQGDDATYVFMHLRRGSILVQPGQPVATGEQIGEVGSTGRSTGPHLHFEVWIDGVPVDPLPLLRTWVS